MPNPVYGCKLASWTSGLLVHDDVVLQGLSGATYETISSDEYEVHNATGYLVRKPYNASGTAADWTGYTAFRASYYLYNPSTDSATGGVITNEAQTVTELDLGIRAADPVTGRLNESTQPLNKFLVGDYLSLGTRGSRPVDSQTGTGIWGDRTGIYGLNANTRQFYLSTADGKAYAGAGAVILDANGIVINTVDEFQAIRSYKFKNESGTEIGSFNAFYTLADDKTDLDITAYNTKAAEIEILASVTDTASNSASVSLGTLKSGSSTQLRLVDDSSDVRYITFSASNNEDARFDSSGRLIVGHTATVNHAGSNFKIQVNSTTTSAASVAGMSAAQWSDDTRSPALYFSKSRGTTAGDFTVVQSGDGIGLIRFNGADGDTFDSGAIIRAIVDGTPGNADMPTRLEFLTSADGSATPTLRLTISSTGLATFANAVTVTGAATLSSTLGVTGKTTIGSGSGVGVNPDNLYVNVDSTGAGDHLATATLINFTGSTSCDSVQGHEGYVEMNHSAGTVTRALASIAHTDLYGAGTVTDAKVFTGSHISRNGCGAITNVYIYKSDGIVRVGTPGTITNGYGLYLDALPSAGVTNRWGVYQVGADDRNYFAGRVFIGNTTESDMTLGLAINQGANDDYILTLKSSDVGHGITDVAEATTYGSFGKVVADRGGLEVNGYKESGDSTPGNALRLRGFLSTVANTTHNASGAAIVDIAASVVSATGGTGAQAPAANSNLVSISSHNTIKFLFDAEGDSFEDGTGWTAYDAHDDIALLDTVNTVLLKAKDPIKQEFWTWVSENAVILQDLKLIHFGADGHHFINRSKMQELLVGAVRQMGARLDRLERGTQ